MRVVRVVHMIRRVASEIIDNGSQRIECHYLTRIGILRSINMPLVAKILSAADALHI